MVPALTRQRCRCKLSLFGTIRNLQSMLISASLVGSRLEALVLQWPGELEVRGGVHERRP